MTSSRSSILRSSLVVLAALALWVGRADAGRKRIVVLDFEGPKAEKFHGDLVKLIKKAHHTVYSTSKWNSRAEDLDATAVTSSNIKKLAKKLKIDGVVTGRIEKRRDDYIIALQLHGGASGKSVGRTVRTKSGSARLDAQSQRDIKDELFALIDELESVRGGGDDEGDDGADEEEDDGPRRKSGFSRKKMMDDDEGDEEDEADSKAEAKRKKEQEEEDRKAEAKRKKEKEEEDKRLAKEEEKRKKDDEKRRKDEERKRKDEDREALATKRDRDDEDEDSGDSSDEEDEDRDDDRKRKRTASRDDDDDDDESIEEEADVDSGRGRDLSVAGRAVDAVVGMSFTARKLQFSYAQDLAKPPPGYKQPVPVAGGLLDVTLYPMSFSKKSKGLIRGIGFNVLYDQVLVINSQKRYADNMGTQQIANLKTSENRWAAGPVLRYPMGKLVVGGSLTYGRQQFSIQQKLPNGDSTDIPNVHYTMITPAAFIHYPVTPKIVLNGNAAFHAITNTGQIQQTGMDGYGAATVTGFEVEGGGDYMVTKNIFARASVRYESISFKFKGDPTSQSNIRDTDPEQDVMGAKDTYLGGTVTVGYVY